MMFLFSKKTWKIKMSAFCDNYTDLYLSERFQGKRSDLRSSYYSR